MPMCTELHDLIWDAKQGFCIWESGLQLQVATGSFPSSRSHSKEIIPHRPYVLVSGCGKQAWKTGLHCTCQAIRMSSWFGKSAPRFVQVCGTAVYGGGWASRGSSQCSGYVEIRWMHCAHGATRVWRLLSWYWQCWALNIRSDPAGRVASQEGHNIQVPTLVTRQKQTWWSRYSRSLCSGLAASHSGNTRLQCVKLPSVQRSL